jgi:hypothetical protein
MRTAPVERLDALAAIATALRDLINSEKHDALLPGLLVCRVAVAADAAASELGRLLDTLRSAASPKAREPR